MREYEGDSRTLGGILRTVAQRNRGRVFVSYHEHSVTYGQLDDTSNQVANGLIMMGLARGDRVAVMLPNCPDFVLVQFGLAKGGMVQVPINIEARGDLLAHYLRNSGPAAIIVDEQYLPLVKSVEQDLANFPPLIVRGERATSSTPEFKKFKKVSSFSGLLFAQSTADPQVQVHYYDAASIFYTSGTTGVSKGVVLPHNHHWHIADAIVRCGNMDSSDIVYNCSPYYHGMAQYMNTLPALLCEGSVVIADRFSSSRFWDDIRRYNATAVYTVYTVPSVLMKQPPKPDDGGNPLRRLFTSGIDPDVWEGFEKRFNVKVLVGYGSTEQNSLTRTRYDEKAPTGSSGRAQADFEVAIVDDDDNALPTGQVGEIVSRPRKPYLQMLGYYGMPDETSKAFRNLWLHSGDSGYFDVDGYLRFVGRAKDAIRRRGENISALEVERVVDSHPSVDQSSAIAVPGDLGEDEIKVDVILKAGELLDPDQLISFCAERSAKYMVPRYVQFRRTLPKTSTQRVQKAKLREEGLTPDTWDGSKHKYTRDLT